MTIEDLRIVLDRAIMSKIQPEVRRMLPGILDDIGVPFAPDEPSLSKRQYIDSRLALLTDSSLPVTTERFLDKFIQSISPRDRFELEELLWKTFPTLVITKRARRSIVKALEEKVPLYVREVPFLKLIQRFWDRSSLEDILFSHEKGGLLHTEVEHHFVHRLGYWTVEDLFEKIGAFESSDRRFALFIEGLVSSDVRPEESNQRAFVAVVNNALAGHNVELREVDVEEGFPIFRFVPLSGHNGRPKNLIFASQSKPDLRFRDAVNNDIEIVSRADEVLVYDRPLPVQGLRWRDLQTWWADVHKTDQDSAKRSLYSRLRKALPKNSPPQSLVFETFFKAFGPRVPDLPALLPEVWLHWDPKTVRERGPDALTRYRMDFLMLFSHEIRVVIEVDGAHHYTDNNGKGDPSRYAAMVHADRDLRLAGYDVYRFGQA